MFAYSISMFAYSIWMGITYKMNDKLNIVREAQKSQIDEEFFIDTKKLLGSADDPHFIKYRQSDKIHLNATGSDKIAQILLQKIKE